MYFYIWRESEVKDYTKRQKQRKRFLTKRNSEINRKRNRKKDNERKRKETL